MGGPVLKSEEGVAAVGVGCEGVCEGRCNCAGTYVYAQGGGTDGVALQERELGSDG